MSQCDRILNLLQIGPVCASAYRVEFPRLAARVGELRASGHQIVRRPCVRGVHGHRSSAQIEYVLVPFETLF